MWSHYSRNHKGICLEFALDDTKFRGALEVQYQKEYPALLLSEQESWIQMIVVKSDVWSYEKEFRLICSRFTDVKEYPFMMDGNYLSIGPNDLKSIILGCQAGDEAAKTLRELVKVHAPTVAVRQARRVLNKYRLVIDA